MNRLSWIMTAAAALAIASGTLGDPPETVLGEFLEQALQIFGG